jgi:hypothetical protein
MIPPFASSALDAVVHVGDAALSLEDPGALEGDLLGWEPVEQTSSLAEEHRDDTLPAKVGEPMKCGKMGPLRVEHPCHATGSATRLGSGTMRM